MKCLFILIYISSVKQGINDLNTATRWALTEAGKHLMKDPASIKPVGVINRYILYVTPLPVPSLKNLFRSVYYDFSTPLFVGVHLLNPSGSFYICQFCGQDIQLIPTENYRIDKIENFRTLLPQVSSSKWRLEFDPIRFPFVDLDKVGQMNPFRLPKNDPNVNFNFHLVYQLLGESNSTIDRHCSIKYMNTLCGPFVPFNFRHLPQISMDQGMEKMSLYGFDAKLILSKMVAFQFLTCYVVKQINFHFYIKPFQMELWVALILSVFVMAFLLQLWIKIWLKTRLSFSPYFFVLSTIVDDAYPVSRNISRHFQFRIVCGVWLLGTVVLTNGYLGLAITGLTSPIPFQSVETFQNLTEGTNCNPYTSCDRFRWRDLYNSRKPFDPSKGFRYVKICTYF